jgi:hypothetical protein
MADDIIKSAKILADFRKALAQDFSIGQAKPFNPRTACGNMRAGQVNADKGCSRIANRMGD